MSDEFFGTSITFFLLSFVMLILLITDTTTQDEKENSTRMVGNICQTIRTSVRDESCRDNKGRPGNLPYPALWNV